jgi:TolA-binding protein
LIKTGTVSMVVQDVDVSFEAALKVAQDHGGDVLQYTNTKTGDKRVADLILQVESGKFEQAMTALRRMSGVVERKVDKADVTEVTDEVVDVQAQIKNLELSEQQLQALLQRTTRTDEILTIQREINNIRVEIDRRKTRAAQLAEQTDLSTITLHLESGPVAAAIAPPGDATWDPSTTAGRAWNASLGILQGIGTVAITIAVFSWWLLPLLLVSWLVYRRYWRVATVRTVATPPAPPAPPAAAGD